LDVWVNDSEICKSIKRIYLRHEFTEKMLGIEEMEYIG